MPELIDILKQVPVHTIEMLAQKHMRRYSARLDAAFNGNTGYRVDELKCLMKYWTNIVAKRYDVMAMTNDERSELYDALDDDDLLPE